jgi:arylsulfatase A
MSSKISRRKFCTALGASSVLLSAPRLATAAGATKKPNVLYIIADDLGWGDTGAYNSDSLIPTKNYDAFAKQGRRFTDMHASAAVCTPSRYSVLTGRYPWRSRMKAGVLGGRSPMLIEPGRLTVPALLKQAGYYTAGVGKWHLGLGDAEETDYSKPLRPGPVTCGFDYYYGIPASLDMAPYLYFENDHTVEMPTVEDPGNHEPRGVTWRAGLRAPHFDIPQVLPTLTAKACSVIEQRAAHPEQPFFLYFAMPSPHTPWVPLPEFRGKSRAGDYGDYVVEVDAMVGKVLAALDAGGLSENTLVILTSDHGAFWAARDIERWGHRSNANWRGEKADVWEGGQRVPFFARWPGHIPAGTVCDETGSLTDLMGTLAAMLGQPLPSDAGEDTYNLLPALLNQERAPIRKAIVSESNDGMLTIREGDWKLELGLGSGGFSAPRRIETVPGGVQGQLYNLQTDPAETNNVWANHPEIVARLTSILNGYEELGRSRVP